MVDTYMNVSVNRDKQIDWSLCFKTTSGTFTDMV